MRAVGFDEFGGPEALRVMDLPEPQAGPGEVRIRVHAAAVNPADTALRSPAGVMWLADREPPHVAGMDCAGVIDQLGPGTGSRLAIGRRVVAILAPAGPHGGAYAEQVVAPEASVVAAPANADFAAASTLLMNALTARLAVDAMNLPPGGTLAVTGAAGAVGGYTIQLAKAAGLQVIADAAPSDEELVRELGADHVVARGDDVAERILALRPEGVRGLVDGSLQGELVFPAIADGGRIAVLRGWNGGTTRGIGVEQVLVLRHAGETATLERLCEQAEQGVLTLRVARVLPAAMAPEAHRELEAGGVRGRLVLDFT